MTAHDPMVLPADLPVPVDDGAAAHLTGLYWPSVPLPSTDGEPVDLSTLPGRTVVYCYPRTGVPGEDPLVPDWDAIPGARGCTPQTCSFRDHHGELVAAGARVVGLSTQVTGYQREAAERLHLPFPLLSDAGLEVTSALRAPTFEVAGETLLRRLTYVIDDGVVTHVWYPVFPPDTHAEVVLDWLVAHPTEQQPA
jgi:peroxiredoxin